MENTLSSNPVTVPYMHSQTYTLTRILSQEGPSVAMVIRSERPNSKKSKSDREANLGWEQQR